MKRGSTIFLKTVVFAIGLGVFALCIIIANTLLKNDVGGYRPILTGMLVTAVPFFIGAYYAYKLLTNIDEKKAFTNSSIKALKVIKNCGIVISVIYGAGLPYIFIMAERDDAPGVALLGFIFTFAPMAIAVFATVIQRLMQNAIDLKSENDLTV